MAGFLRQEVESIGGLLATEPDARAARRYEAEQRKLEANPEVRARLREINERTWAAWLDERIPALGNKTPREAAKSPAGRERLDALLDDLAWRARRRGGESQPDIAALRAALGLDPIRAPGRPEGRGGESGERPRSSAGRVN